MDSSKCFETMNQDLLIPNLGAYDLQEVKQRVQVNSKFSTWERIIFERHN